MNFSLTEEPKKDLIIIEMDGNFDFTNIIKIFTELESSQLYRSGASILTDLSQLDLTALANDDVKLLAQQVSGLTFQNSDRKCAMIVSNNAHDYGMARMWEIQTQDAVKASLKIFQNGDEALSWLQNPEDND